MRWKHWRQVSPTKFRRLTGVTPALFAQMREAALAHTPASSHPAGGGRCGPKPKLRLEDQLLMLLTYYREYRTFAHVGASFGVSEAQSAGASSPLWKRACSPTGVFTSPASRACVATRPGKASSWTWASVPASGQKKPRACYSGKKRHHPLKAQVLLERHTRRILAVHVGKGRRHGFDLFKRSRARVHPAVERFADTGCQGLQKLHANTRKPAKATKNTRSPASRSAPTARSTPGAWSSSTASVA